MSTNYWSEEDAITYFISGSNHAGEIKGLALSGHDVGIAVPEANEAALRELEMYRCGPLQVFVDSGAFSEVSFPGGVPTITDPISPAEWDRRLAVYERLARSLRSQVWLVAPDCVAHQRETLERLTTYAPRLQTLLQERANLIVPVQKGSLSMLAFSERVVELLGTDDLVWGIPMKKDATSLDELADFVAGLQLQGRPARIHLLGLGRKSKLYAAAIRTIRLNHREPRITCDSVRITALVGRTNGVGGGPRPLTVARDRAVAKGITGTAAIKYAAVHDVFLSEVRREIQAARRAGWYDEELESAPGVPLEPGCIDYGPGGPFGEDSEAAHG